MRTLKDPMGSFETIKENFIRYIKTAFGTKFEGVEKERYDLLNVDKVLYRKPWIELLPDYLSSNKKISDLTAADLSNALTEDELNSFKALVQTGLFPAEAKLHFHQAEMLKFACAGENCIITSGTGSGKTESFLLPLFAQLVKELQHWAPPHQKPASINTWWRETNRGGLPPNRIVDTSTFSLNDNTLQRGHEARASAVRGLILYPMNALVEDQMSRLRKALDSDTTRHWQAKSCNGNTIYFGRYNGDTPVAGSLRRIEDDGTFSINDRKVKELKKRLQIIEQDALKVEEYIHQNNSSNAEANDLKSFFPRLDGSEMRCRFDMQSAPPDILITNYSMLSIMLMREVDSGIFEETRRWLACEDIDKNEQEHEKSKRIFHLIIDELHLYRGTQGTEVAYLLKLVLNRLGLHPHHPQLRILASSASLEPGDDDSIKFLEDFFGIDSRIKPFKIIQGSHNPLTILNENTIHKLPIGPFKDIAHQYQNVKEDVNDVAFINSCQGAADDIAKLFGCQVNGTGIERLISIMIHPNIKLKERLYSAASFVNEINEIIFKPICSSRGVLDNNNPIVFAERLFEDASSLDTEMALRGLLIARALFEEGSVSHVVSALSDNEKLPRMRFHFFFRNIEGLWASVNPSEIDNVKYADGERPVGKLYPNTRISSENGNRVLELLYCDNCGTLLLGGSRLLSRSPSGTQGFELLPISPNIEGIPEKTPGKLVEQRSYQEYGIFWPSGKQDFLLHDVEPGIPAGYWRQTTINGFHQTDYRANWIPASLNMISGDITLQHDECDNNPDSWLKGYYFTIVSENDGIDIALSSNTLIPSLDTHKALPNCCPCCGINHQKRTNDSRKIKTSPIRGFRTGFAKTTQMFAKELMYQLPDNKKERKLVVFSDSREDAARVANDIERNHFTDLLREVLVDELHKRVLIKNKILEAITQNKINEINAYNVSHPLEVQEIQARLTLSQLPGTASLIIEQKRKAEQELTKIRERLFSVRELVDITNSRELAPLIAKMVKLGVNPGGNGIDIQTRLLNGEFVPWYELFDTTNDAEWRPGADPVFIESLKEGALSNLASMFFGSLFYSLEASALGYVSINPTLPSIVSHAANLGIQSSTLLEAINSTIRILGDKYKHNKNEDSDPFNLINYPAFPSQAKRYITTVANVHGLNHMQLGDAIYDILSESRTLHGARGIIIEELFIKIASPTDPVWTSSRGNRAHLHASAGVSTYPIARLNQHPDKICDELWQENYLSYNAIKMQRNPIRLHCEELTGQTDNQFLRQRHFRNVILPDEGNVDVKSIDLLSVTTTLEVGVDIGSLQAVMLGNMPPQRFNYQQRVGRAGRRGQAYSVVLTFCRGRSHDEFYFSNPQKITGDAPPTPFLTIGQERIFKRLLSKEILRRAYLEQEIDISIDERSSVHGEFGSIGLNQTNWLSYKERIKEWIDTNHVNIQQLIDFLLPPALHNKRNGIIQWTLDTNGEDGFIAKCQSIISNNEIASEDISEKLAEGGILPMFGMPTTVKNLYHGISHELEPLSIDRPQAMAIYEFAPGAQKTKDKAIHTVIGFTSDIIRARQRGFETIRNSDSPSQLPFSLNRWMIKCKSCGFFETYSEDEKHAFDSQNHFTACPNCGESSEKYQRPVKLKSPRGYRTNLSLGKDLKDDSEIQLSKPPIFAEKVSDSENPDLTNYYGNSIIVLSDKDVTWRINTNSDRFYSGRLYTTTQIIPYGPAAGFRLNSQWIADQLAVDYSNNGFEMQLSPMPASNSELIALASQKKTEIFRIAPAKVPLPLDINMFSREYEPAFVKAQANGVRAGYYSAAFLLQRIIADRLDIDPTEIEIADIIMKELGDGTNRRVAEMVLTDELPNGSGFVRYMFENYANILDEALSPSESGSYMGKITSAIHQSSCLDACYECLKVYRNMNYHGLLDWRLGLSILRILRDDNFICGADGIFDRYFEISDWLGFAVSLRNRFCQGFGFRHMDEVNGLPIIKYGPQQRNIMMIVHPFWDIKNIIEDNWLAETKAEIQLYLENSEGKLSIVDSFNLHRRPGWCYEKLVQR